MKTKSTNPKKNLPLAQVYRLLEPGPVVLVSTFDKGKANIMVMSWQTMMEFEPPLVGCVISEKNFSFRALSKTKECVLNIPTVELADRVAKCGNTSGRKVDKFSKFKLTPVPAMRVKAPLIGECYANLECRVMDTALVQKYNFFVLQVVKAWIDPSRKDPRTIHHRGKGNFMFAGRTVKLASKMK